MKYLLHRLTALMLAILVLVSALPLVGAEERPDPACTLGTFSGDMLVGGTQVRTEGGLFYIGDDGFVYNTRQGSAPVYAKPAARLNYLDGVLYMARPHEDGFDLVSYDLTAGTETVYLENFSGDLRQLYVVDGSRLVFLVDHTVMELSLETRAFRILRFNEKLWSFVPTGCGLVWAAGTLFDYSLYAEDCLLAEHVDGYYVDFDMGDGMLVYTQNGVDYQIDLGDAFLGRVQSVEFTGVELVNAASEGDGPQLTEDKILAHEADGAEHSHDGLDDVDDAPINRAEERAPAQPLKKQPNAMAGYPRRQTTTDVENIVKRAHQMLDIYWTPRKDLKSWGGYFTYQAGVTYRGLPYCQAVSGYGGYYVPWAASLETFIEVTNDANSKQYTGRCTYGNGGPSYGVDCSAFVSWALDLPYRRTTWTLANYGTQKKSSVSAISVGDFLNKFDAHVVLVTDVAYNSDGTLAGVEISESTVWDSDEKLGCCRSTWFSGSEGLAKLNTKYFGGGYKLYSRKYDRAVSYRHSCVVPLEGDECILCGAGLPLRMGVDVSEAEGGLDWQTLAPYADFAMIRIGGRTEDGVLNRDARFADNLIGCEANGIPYGLYFDSAAHDGTEAREEAEFVLDTLAETDGSPQLPIFMNVEGTDMLSDLNSDQLLDTISSFCEYLEEIGFRTGVYAGEGAWKEQLTRKYYQETFSWVSSWAEEDGSVPPSAVLTLNTGANIWQYGKKTLPGVTASDGQNVRANVDYWFGEAGSREHRCTATLALPGCTKSGSLTSRCVDCDLSISRVLPPLGHDWNAPVFTWNGSESATATRTCAADPSHTETKNCKVTSVETEAAGCETPGEATCTATAVFADGAVAIDTIRAALPALGHAWDAGVVTTPPTWTEPGVRTFTCTRCEATMTKTIPAVSETGSAENNPFPDVKESAYYFLPVLWAVHCEPQVTAGVSKTRFAPNDTCTREQVVTFLWRAAGCPKPSAEDCPFTDVKKGGYYEEAVLWAVETGVTHGVNRTKFGVGEACTRAQVVTFLRRAKGAPTPSTTDNPFRDVSADTYYCSAVLWAVETGVTAGTSKTRFSPNDVCTRGQIVTFLYRAYH